MRQYFKYSRFNGTLQGVVGRCVGTNKNLRHYLYIAKCNAADEGLQWDFFENGLIMNAFSGACMSMPHQGQTLSEVGGRVVAHECDFHDARQRWSMWIVDSSRSPSAAT
eukprot:TRINITY_DN26625_c0_g1_i1.p5 TRINITY_DN26625_c0_g1~~TRINITY_DN26625_c0_g1_i1.p5  ORF type:complete len:109 (-),score=27.76 TRINITY_DN26625_c0_g1_i1:97-423(-)